MSELDDVFDLSEYLEDPAFAAAYEDTEARQRLLRGLVAQRKVMRLRQVDVAARMQTKQSFVSDLERGVTDPQLSTLQRYARAVAARLEFRIDLPADCPWDSTQRWSALKPGAGYARRGTVTTFDSETIATAAPIADWRRSPEGRRLEFQSA